jgi:Tfp pilus assembly protein PilN
MQRLLGAFRSSGRSPLKVLDAVSESVPIQGGLRFETFKLDRDTVYIEAKAESFLPAEDFEAALREHPGFEGVELKGQKTGASGGSPAGSLFVITATLKPEVF